MLVGCEHLLSWRELIHLAPAVNDRFPPGLHVLPRQTDHQVGDRFGAGHGLR